MLFHAIIGLFVGSVLNFVMLAIGHGRAEDYNNSVAARLSGRRAVFRPNWLTIGLVEVIIISLAVILGRILS